MYNKSKTINPHQNYRRYRHYSCYSYKSKMALAGSWSDVGGAHIQAFTFSSQDHCRLFEVRISKHSLFRLKITVGCLTSTYPSIHVETQDHGPCLVFPCLALPCLVLSCLVLCGVVSGIFPLSLRPFVPSSLRPSRWRVCGSARGFHGSASVLGWFCPWC